MIHFTNVKTEVMVRAQSNDINSALTFSTNNKARKTLRQVRREGMQITTPGKEFFQLFKRLSDI